MKPPKLSFSKPEAAALLIVVIIGIVHLNFPFDGDQALFLVGARKIAHGAVLYRDFWDIKQPGVFIFYLAGGSIFGFSEFGIHLFELLYMLMFSAVVLVTLRDRFNNKAIAALLPLLTVGYYYAVSGSWHLTQVEALAGFPIYVCAYLSSRTNSLERFTSSSAVAFGLASALVLLFKLMFAPILVVFWIIGLSHHLQSAAAADRIRKAISYSLLALGAMSLPIVFVAIYFAANHAFIVFGYTMFVFPYRAFIRAHSVGGSAFLDGIRFFISNFAPMMSIAVFSGLLIRNRKLNTLVITLIGWIVTGLCIILVQRLSWWEYQYLLLSAPIGILCAIGLDELDRILRNASPPDNDRVTTWVFSAVVFIVFSPTLIGLSLKSISFLRFGFSTTGTVEFQNRFSNAYRNEREIAGTLSAPQSRPGPIFVCGNPTIYVLSKRDQAISSNGWMLELYLPEQWSRLEDELSQNPPAYIFVSTEFSLLIPEQSIRIEQLLQTRFTIAKTTAMGILYERNS